MSQESESIYFESSENELVSKFLTSIKHNKTLYFDTEEYEEIIEHYLVRGIFDIALSAINKAIELHPNYTDFLFYKAQTLIELKQPTEVFALLTYIEKVEPNNQEVHFLKGCTYCQTGNLEEAITCFNLALDICDDNKAELLYNCAVNFIHISEFNIAIEYLKYAIKEDPLCYNLHYDIGYCYDQIDENELSINHYNHFLDNDPFSDLVWFNLGTVFSKTNQYALAIEAYEYAIALNDRNSLAYLYKGNTLANNEQFHDAIALYKEFLILEPNDPEALCYIGECYERIDLYDLALSYYSRTIEIDPEYADAHYGISIVLSYKNNFSDSIKFLNKAISLDSGNAEYWFTLGNLYHKLKFDEKAIDSYRKAVELDPYDSESWLNMSEVYLKKNLLSKAIKILEDSYQYTSDDTSINYRLAAYNFLKCDILQGVYYFRRGFDEDTSDPSELFKYCPDARNIREVKDILKKYKY